MYLSFFSVLLEESYLELSLESFFLLKEGDSEACSLSWALSSAFLAFIRDSTF